MSVLPVDKTSLRTVRLRAGAPRIAAMTTVAILALTGLRAIVQPRTTTLVQRAPQAQGEDFTAESFAQAFVRAYLTWRGADPQARQNALAPFLSDGVDTAAGVVPSGHRRQTVSWTTIAGVQRDGSRTLITVAAGTSHGVLYVAVPVGRDSRGRLAVADLPALVGAPPGGASLDVSDEPVVDDPDLTIVAQRAIKNYLEGQRGDLLADLTPDAVVALPPQPLRVESVEAPTWVQGRRVALVVHARDRRKTEWSFRYELTVVKRDRWYVRSIQVDPTQKGGR